MNTFPIWKKNWVAWTRNKEIKLCPRYSFVTLKFVINEGTIPINNWTEKNQKLIAYKGIEFVLASDFPSINC